MLQIKVERPSEDGLSLRVWLFVYQERRHALEISEYAIYHRRTVRHKFRLSGQYRAMFHRDSFVKKDQVPMPEDVSDEARMEFTTTLKIEV